MKSIDRRDVISIARQLGDSDIHVFRLPYRREEKREPLRQVLGTYLGISSGDVVLVDGQFGRPGWGGCHDTRLGFNWSHSGDCALIAIGRDLAPGIDIERRCDRVRVLDIAKRYFCKDEWAALMATPAAMRSLAFLELWTAKEAVLKALGRGIAFGLDRLHLTSEQGRLELRWLDGDDVRAWQLQSIEVGEGYVAALAWRGAARQVQCWTMAT